MLPGSAIMADEDEEGLGYPTILTNIRGIGGCLINPEPHELKSYYSSGLKVELLATARGLGGFAGFHTSILMAGEEYFFSPTGIRCCSYPISHPSLLQAIRIGVGVSKATGQELYNFLSEHFQSGSYDFLRKNCNAFTDCALYFLCEKRLDLRYRAMEKLGWMAESQTGILHSISEGEYTANPEAENFDVEDVLEEIAERWEGCSEESDTEVPQSLSCWPPMMGVR